MQLLRRVYHMLQMRKWCSLLLAVAFLFTMAPAQAIERTTLRVGYYALEGYQDLAADGTRSGYGYDLLQMLARYKPIKYTYHGYNESIVALMRHLENGELDLITGLKPTPDTAERFDFSTHRIGMDSTILTIREGNEQIISGDYKTYNGIRIGILTGSYRSAELAAFAQEKGFSYSLVNYRTTDELTKALHSGAVDALVSSSLRTIDRSS